MTLQLSPNQMTKAMGVYETLAQQNQAMDQVNLDLTDIVNTLFGWDLGDDAVQMTRVVPKNAQDVASIVADAAARIRIAREKYRVMLQQTEEEMERLRDQVEALSEDNEDLNRQLDDLEEELAGAK